MGAVQLAVETALLLLPQILLQTECCFPDSQQHQLPDPSAA
jgi:hypothetical protein